MSVYWEKKSHPVSLGLKEHLFKPEGFSAHIHIRGIYKEVFVEMRVFGTMLNFGHQP